MRLMLAQRLHAALIFWVPLVATAAAIPLAWRRGVTGTDVALLVGLYTVTILGITVGFHRYLAHRAFRPCTAVKIALVIAGSMAVQGPPIYWVSNHRRHHQHSDEPGDPHSPYFDGATRLGRLRGVLHAHAGWTFGHQITNAVVFTKDWLRDPLVSRLSRLYYVWVALSLVLPAVLGGVATRTWMGAFTGFLWGGLVRVFLTYHATNSINSITHVFGRRPFATREQSRNNAWLVIPTAGEAWHNNHHAFPASAIFGLRWWQVDLGGWVVMGLDALGLVREVNRPTPAMVQARRMSSMPNANTA